MASPQKIFISNQPPTPVETIAKERENCPFDLWRYVGDDIILDPTSYPALCETYKLLSL